MLAPQAVARAISPSQVERSVSRLMMYFNIVNIISRACSRKKSEINGKKIRRFLLREGKKSGCLLAMLLAVCYSRTLLRAMMRLHSLSKKRINDLAPATLNRLGVFFQSIARNFHFEEEPALLHCSLDGRCMPQDKVLKAAYFRMRQAFYRSLEQLQFHDEGDNQVIYMAHHIGCANEELADLLQGRYGTKDREGVNCTEYVAQVLLERGIEVIREASVSLSACRSRSYMYAVYNPGALPFPRTSVEPGEAFDRLFESRLRPHLEKNYKTGICSVHSERKNGCWALEIMHGGARRKELVEEERKTVDGTSQPIEIDVLIYDPACDDVRVHMQTKRVRMVSQYCRELSTILYSSDNHWREGDKFDLDVFRLHREELQAMLCRGEHMLKNAEIGDVRIDLVAVTYGEPRLVADSQRYTDDITRRNPQGLNHSLPRGMRLIPDESPYIRGVELRIRCGARRKVRSFPVLLKAREGCAMINQIPGLEDWLLSEGISKVRDRGKDVDYVSCCRNRREA